MEPKQQRKTQFLQAFDEHSSALFRHAYYRVYERELARDLVQDAFLKTWAQIAERDADIVTIKAFLYKVLNNLIIDWSRKRKEDSLDAMQDGGFEPAARVSDSPFSFLDAERALEKLRELPEAYRAVIVMRYLDEMGPGEIAGLTGETENVISVRLSRGIKMLRERIGNTTV
jgi:RNA polymerase sigma-70 factor (ECF subfamily)